MNSSNIIIGPGYLSRNGANYRFNEGGLKVKFMRKWREVSAEEFGRFDSTQTDRSVEITGKLWSGYENLGELFPATMLTPVIGSTLFGIADKLATINGQDGSRLLVARTMFTEFTNLDLSVEKELWSADIKLIGLLASGSTPTDAPNAATGAPYFVESEGNAYAPPAFNKSAFRAPIITAAWGTRPGFTSFVPRKGVALAGKYALDPEPCYVNGYGTLDMIVDGFEGEAKMTPIGPTLAQILANCGMGGALGALQSTANTDNLVLTASGLAITLFAAFLGDHDAVAWARKNNRIGDWTWRSTVPFAAGLPTARAAIA
jgi:hypothetical protein